MTRVSGNGSAQEVDPFAGRIHAATGVMAERHNPVDVRELSQGLGPKGGCDVLGHRRRAVDGCDHANEISGRDSTIGTSDAEECFGHVGRLGRFKPSPEGIVPIKISHFEIVGVNMMATGDRRRCKPNDLRVTTYRFACRDVTAGDFVSGWDRFLALQPSRVA